MTRLLVWRREQGLNQQEAARTLGLGIAFYQLLESGRLSPSEAQMARLRAYFGDRADGMLRRLSSGAGIAS